MTEITKNQLVAGLAKDVVAEQAPKELPMFRARSAAYFKDPDRILKDQTGKDEMLGFGVEVAVPILTPVILAMATAIVNFVVEAVMEPVQEETKDLIGDGVRVTLGKLRNLGSESKEDATTLSVKPLTPEQLMQVRELAIQQALQLRLSERTAETLADSLLGRLAVSN